MVIENPITAVKIRGESLINLPHDLYIPPDALRVFLEAFEGPLDLLLYLIRKQDFDILDIPLAEITRQYMQYIEVMHELHLELAAEYLLMAAILAEIKSRWLLPKPAALETEEGDPRVELVRRLQEYERYQQAAQELNKLPRVERDIFVVDVDYPSFQKEVPKPLISLADIFNALQGVRQRASLYVHHQVALEMLSVRERMSIVLSRLNTNQFVAFTQFFKVAEGRMGVAVTLLAILELIRQTTIELVQTQPYAAIYIKSREL